MVSQVHIIAALNHYSNFTAIQTEIYDMVLNHIKKVCVKLLYIISTFSYRNDATKIFLISKSKLSAF